MRTSFSMLLEQVAARLGAQPLFSRRTLDTPVRAVAPLEGGQPFLDDVLYIADAPPDAPECPAQLFSLRAPGSGASGNLAVFPASITREGLLGAAQEAFGFYARWGDGVLDLIAANAGLDAIVNYAYATFKNPILIYDSSLKVLAYTRNDGSTDRMWRDTVQRGSVYGMTAEEAREFQRFVNKLDNSPKPFRHIAQNLTDPFYNGNILLNGQRVGMVDLMERNHPVTPGEIDLLEALCFLLAFELQKDATRRENRGLIYHQLIVDLLDGSIRDEGSLQARLTAAHWRPTPFTRVVCFQPENAFMAEPELRRAFDHLLALSIGRGILRERELLFLLPCTDEAWSPEQGALLCGYCASHQLRCGVSDAYADLLQTALHVPQAAQALVLCEEQVVVFGQVRFRQLLRLCGAQASAGGLLHPAIAQLAAHDAQHGSEYLATLEALFDSQYNQMIAARALHIHRTTLIYRLQRISELTGLRMDDAQEMLYAHFSLCVFRSLQSPAP